MEAAGALLTQDLNRVLLDLGDRKVNGSGLLGAMTTGAATARSADYQLALATDTTTSYANVRSADIGGLLLRQAQSDASLQMAAALPAFGMDLPTGTEHRTVYTFHIGSASRPARPPGAPPAGRRLLAVVALEHGPVLLLARRVRGGARHAGPAGAGRPGRREAPDDLAIGVVVSLTGEGSDWSETAEGARVATYRYGLGERAVELRPVDDKGTARGRHRRRRKLVDQASPASSWPPRASTSGPPSRGPPTPASPCCCPTRPTAPVSRTVPG